MIFKDGKRYIVEQLSIAYPDWKEVQKAVAQCTNDDNNLVELYDVMWRKQPFSWSYHKQFKPKSMA